MKSTQEQVITWAREAGMEVGAGLLMKDVYGQSPSIEHIQAAIALAYEAGRKDENEACAEVCEEIARLYSTDIFPEDGTSIDCNSAKMGRVVTRNCAQSIRARREQ